MRAVSTGAEQVASLLREAERAVVLTGAGISVPSGIPDFRSPGTGLWEKVDPMEVAHIDAWRRDPDRFWSFYGERFASLTDKQPNEAHLALAELERRGLVRAVITQNIDRLHRLAGSERLIEVHGSIDRSVCMECGAKVSIERVVELLASSDGAPLCEACVAPLKPDVVLFGELLPEQALAEAQQLAMDADLMICVGSSLEVYPVAGLPAITHGGGGRLVLVTQGPTPYDGNAEVKLGRRRRDRAARGPRGALAAQSPPPQRSLHRGDGVLKRRGVLARQGAAQCSVCCRGHGLAMRCQLVGAARGEERLDRHTALQRRLRRPTGIQVGPGPQHELLGGVDLLATSQQRGEALLRSLHRALHPPAGQAR